MKKGLIILGVICLIGILFASSIIGVWNNLNYKVQEVKGGKSHYSAALKTASEKIKGVWNLSNQYLNHESDTFKGVAQARSGFLAAQQAFEQAKKSGNESDIIKKAQVAQGQFSEFQRSAGLAINVVFEKYPDLKGVETTKQAMRAVEEGVNEIKTSLDDWIHNIKEYNQYRGSAWASIIGGFMPKFPAEIEYYEGNVKELDMDSLNPASQK